MKDETPVVVEEGTINDIPSPELIVEERYPNPPPKFVPLPKGLIVKAMEGVTCLSDTG
jgi:hypothetical protein